MRARSSTALPDLVVIDGKLYRAEKRGVVLLAEDYESALELMKREVREDELVVGISTELEEHFKNVLYLRDFTKCPTSSRVHITHIELMNVQHLEFFLFTAKRFILYAVTPPPPRISRFCVTTVCLWGSR